MEPVLKGKKQVTYEGKQVGKVLKKSWNIDKDVPWVGPRPTWAHCLPASTPLSCAASAPCAGTG